ncbi:MAG TPA: hypothetical protein VNU28_01985 [Solirubrobacteraceae bacterium]|jgi:hypothetical protein|nr:hypothetical protein [Solirubrobacteraceae bacterium]
MRVLSPLLACALIALGAPGAALAATAAFLPHSDYTARQACAPPTLGAAGCLALQLQPATAAARARVHPYGVASNTHAGVAVAAECSHAYESSCLTPQELNDAYFPGEQPDGPASEPERQTIALVDAYNDPEAEHDLRIYDEEFKLPECSAANGCFEQVNEDGASAPSSLPFPQTELELEAEEAICKGKKAQQRAACKTVEEAQGWSLEIATDVEVAHGVCQNCRIRLVEAASPEYPALQTAEEAAVALHATEISNSWGGLETGADNEDFNHPGIVVTAAAGDDGYLNWEQYATRNENGSPYFEGADYPASSPDVIAVGGTSLTLGADSAWAGETVWNKEGGAGGGGCGEQPAQSWQREDSVKAGCKGAERAVADVSADADPTTGVAIYDSVPYPHETEPLDWVPIGGTSLASPIIASMFALAGGAHNVAYPAQTLYSHLSSPLLHDVTAGGNGACDQDYSSCGGSLSSPLDCGPGTWICNATAGYDGPTGVGTPNGIGAFKPSEEGTKTSKSVEEVGKSKGVGSEGSGGATNESGGNGTINPGSTSTGNGGKAGGTSTGTGSVASDAPAPRITALTLTAYARAALRHGRLEISSLAFSCRLSRATQVKVTLAIRIRSSGRARWRTLHRSLTFAAVTGINRHRLHGSNVLAPDIYRLTLAPAGGTARSLTIRVS